MEGATQCCLALNVAVSAILLAYSMGASTVYAVGMDGYADEFNKHMVYFYNEDSRVDDKDTANFRYETLARELDRVNSFLQAQSVPTNLPPCYSGVQMTLFGEMVSAPIGRSVRGRRR